MLSHLAFIPRLSMLVRTFEAAAEETLDFFIILAIIFFGSSQAFFLAFGPSTFCRTLF